MVRRYPPAELLGVETGWDGATGSVTVKGDVKKPAQPVTPPDTTASTDYSNWSVEEEAAYQEFKGMWEISIKGKDDKRLLGNGEYDYTPWEAYWLTYVGGGHENLYDVISSAHRKGYVERLAHETRKDNVIVAMWFCIEREKTIKFIEIAS